MWGGRRIAAPPGRETRPTSDRVREAWMSALAGDLPDARVLDLFAGSGALGLEALSRGAAHVTFVENAPAALAVIQRNVDHLSPPPGSFEIRRTDAVRMAETLKPYAYDVAFADPPYGRALATRLGEIFARTPFAAVLCLEHGPDENPGGESAARRRRYGDTVLTFLTAEP
jgi:16S rRNA (guanine966-N2)-methyltransferase